MINFTVAVGCLYGEQRSDGDSLKVSGVYLTALDVDLTFKYKWWNLCPKCWQWKITCMASSNRKLGEKLWQGKKQDEIE